MRIEFQRSGQHLKRLVISFLRVPIPELTPPQEEFMSVYVLCSATINQCFFGRAQLNLERGNNLLREFVLHCEDVGEVTIEAVGPDMRTALSIDELARDSDPVVRLTNAAFQHVAHAEFATDLFYVYWLALVGKTRVAGDNA